MGKPNRSILESIAYSMCLVSLFLHSGSSIAVDLNGDLKMFDGGLFSVDAEFNFDKEIERLENLAINFPVKLREEAELFLESDSLRGFMADTADQLDKLITKGLVCTSQILQTTVNTTIIAKSPISKECIRSVGEKCSALTPKFNCPRLNPAQLVLAESCELKRFVRRNTDTTRFLENVSAKSESMAESSRMVYLCGTTKENGIAEISLEAMWLREAFLYLQNSLSSSCKNMAECASHLLENARLSAKDICDLEFKDRLHSEYDRIEDKVSMDIDQQIIAIMQIYLGIQSQNLNEKMIATNNKLYSNNLRHFCSVSDVGRRGSSAVIEHDPSIVVGDTELQRITEFFTGPRATCLIESTRTFKKNYVDRVAGTYVELDKCGMGHRSTRTDCEGEVEKSSAPAWTGDICP